MLVDIFLEFWSQLSFFVKMCSLLACTCIVFPGPVCGSWAVLGRHSFEFAPHLLPTGSPLALYLLCTYPAQAILHYINFLHFIVEYILWIFNFISSSHKIVLTASLHMHCIYMAGVRLLGGSWAAFLWACSPLAPHWLPTCSVFTTHLTCTSYYALHYYFFFSMKIFC